MLKFRKLIPFTFLVMVFFVLFACETQTVSFTVNFNSNGGSHVESITTDGNSSVAIPDDPEKEGYDFAGWYWDNSTFEDPFTSNSLLDRPISSNLTVYAKWEINQYTITYNTYDNYDPLTDIPLQEGETITQVSLGVNHSSALTSDGRFFTWGANWRGQLGDGTTTDRNTPTDITSQFNLNEGETIAQVLLGGLHSSALTSEGRVFTWGRNESGELGDGTTTARDEANPNPTEITGQFSLNTGETITSMSLGDSHSSAITSEGRVFTWGWNWFGQLGDGTTTDRHTPTDITGQFSLNTGETITSMSLGGAHSSVITSEGRIFTWGYNESGQLGDGTTTTRNTPTDITGQFSLNTGETIAQVSLGVLLSSAITSEGRIFTWGDNGFGQLGDGTTTDRNTPTEITGQFSLNTVETITSMSLGDSHSSAITSEGRVFTWGWNDYGQLGDGTTTDKHIPTEITGQFSLNTVETITSMSLGWEHSSAITSEGRIFTWGSNQSGQLGDGTTTDRNTPIMLPFKSPYSTEISVFDYGESLDETIPIREGYTFDGWYSDAGLTQSYTFTTMPAENLILYGKWILIE